MDRYATTALRGRTQAPQLNTIAAIYVQSLLTYRINL